MWFSSGRGPEPDDEDIADPFNGKRFTVCIFLPMEIVTFSERVKVVEVGKLVEIPSEIQVHQAISKLYKNKEKHPDKFACSVPPVFFHQIHSKLKTNGGGSWDKHHIFP